MSAIDYGIVLLVLDPRTGEVRALHGEDRARSSALATARVAEVPPTTGGTVDIAVRLTDPPRLPLADRLRAWAAVAEVLGLGRRFDRLWDRLSGLSGRTRRTATPTEAEDAVTAVRAVCRSLPAGQRRFQTEGGAAAILLARKGLRVDLRHGATIDPVVVRTWLEVDGAPVSEPSWIDRFTAFGPIDPSSSHPDG